MQQIELLAPAKNLDFGIDAINCGADAVYIGGPRFGARAAAGNSLDDIQALADYSHRFHVRTYVTLNTILRNEELHEAEKLIHQIWNAGADALIIQDMGVLEMEIPPIPLYASTQCHISSPEKAVFLEKAGFKRLILARELSLDEIKAIRVKTSLELECFVHGALCVSYSGQCYMSYAAGGRSGNRGECAQPCRLPYSLLDEAGNLLMRDKYLLSLKDLNQSAGIDDMLDAGISSFKIEGRLKDRGYIRNVVSHYRRLLDKAITQREWKKSSSGRSEVPFLPDPAKSFNRGFTQLYLNGESDKPESPFTQKSTGETLGRIARVDSESFVLERNSNLHSGDGICFFKPDGVLDGMRLERVDGNRIFPADLRYFKKGMELYRNLDREFDRKVTNSNPERRLGVRLLLTQEKAGFSLSACDEDGFTARNQYTENIEPARDEGQARSTIKKQLSKTGSTSVRVDELRIDWNYPMFIPVKLLNQARRTLLDNLVAARIAGYQRMQNIMEPNDYPYPAKILSFEGNVLNKKAEAFYRRHGVTAIQPAAESGLDMKARKVITTRHCIRRIAGLCERYPGNPALALDTIPEGDLFLNNGKHRYRLEFDCRRCEMRVYTEGHERHSSDKPSLNRNLGKT